MFKKILVPIDLQDTEFSLSAVNVALREMRETGHELHMISVLPGLNNNLVSTFLKDVDQQDVLNKAAQELIGFAQKNVDSTIKTKLKVFQGSASEEINRYIQKNDIDLVIVRAHQRRKINEFLLGSVSARVVERAHCSVFVLKD